MERTKDKQMRRGVPADGGAGERRKGGPEAVVRDTRPRRPIASTDVSSRLFPPNKYERTRRPNQIKWFAWRDEPRSFRLRFPHLCSFMRCPLRPGERGSRRPAPMAAPRPLALFLVVLLLTSLPPTAEGLRLSQWGTLVSLSHSLLTRVANARAARDDLAGADRVRKIADKLSLLGGSGGGIWSLGRDFAWNYAWRGGRVPTAEISRATSRLLEALAEASRIESAAERSRWALRNYRHLVDLADSLFKSLLRTFSRSGPLREMVLALQREVAEGELFKDCLEIVAVDLEGLIRIVRDAFLSSSNVDEGEL
ncbi:unnamed protein product [Musa acuminata subsp. burmannicoides]